TSQRIESSDEVENVFNQGRISLDMETDEGVEIVVDQEKNAEVEGRHTDKQAEIYNIDLDHSSKVAAASTPIPAAKPKTLKITDAAPAVLTRKRKRVVIRDPEEELHTDTPAKTPTVKDKGKGILIEDPKPMKKKDQVEMDAERHLEIVQDEDDDVFVEAIPLAQKDAIWRNQKSVHGLALVKRWKLLTSCGVHVIILSTVQLFLLVERRYPLSRFTLEQLVNVARLQVEEEKIYNIDLDHSSKVAAASTPIPAAKPKTLKITDAAPAVLTRKRKRVVIRDPEEELHTDTPAKTPTVKDKGKGILIEDPKPMK
nr:hypothetical protein [Tanacetum cinerariifolium]